LNKDSILKESKTHTRKRMTEQLSIEQIDASKRVLKIFQETSDRWAMLIAQMQCGKTSTFLLVAAEAFRENLVNRSNQITQAIIFCGNPETALKNQLKRDIRNFKSKYSLYLDERHPDLPIETRDLIMNRMDKMEKDVMFGSDLDVSKNQHLTLIKNTLWIWEESHCASSKKNRPNLLLKYLGMRADGSIKPLKSKNNYVLSVSATPFSELASYFHKNKEHLKQLVWLEPGVGYKGVGHYLENHRIKGFAEWKEQLDTNLSNTYAGVTNKYGIVRIPPSHKNKKDPMNYAKQIATDHDWKYQVIDSESISDNRLDHGEDYDPINDLNDAPDHNTLILIRGMYRMGKVVPKPHIAFVMETSKNPKTDTALQGLIGRMCGYGINDGEEPDIYINNKILTKITKEDKSTTELEENGTTELGENGTTELENYVNLMKTHSLRNLPRRGRDLKDNTNDSKSESLYHLFPVVLTGFTNKECHSSKNIDELTNQIIQRINNNIHICNNNGPTHTTQLIQQLLTHPVTKINRKFIINKENNKPTKTYQKVPNLFNEILKKSESTDIVHRTESCGIKKNEINLWIFNIDKCKDEDYSCPFTNGTIIIQSACAVDEDGNLPHKPNPADSSIPEPKNNSAFVMSCEEEELDTPESDTVISDITMDSIKSKTKSKTSSKKSKAKKSTKLDKDTTSDEDTDDEDGFPKQQKEESCDIDGCVIKLTMETSTTVHKMISFLDTIIGWSQNNMVDRFLQSVLVSEVVYKEMLKSGSIFKYINEKYNLKIKVSCAPGRRSKECIESGLKRLSKIEW